MIVIDETGTRRLTERERLLLHLAMEHEDAFPLPALHRHAALEATAQKPTESVVARDGWQAAQEPAAGLAQSGLSATVVT